ncbi:MAG TPA: hypothetical protein VFE31_09445 [Opitutaceae bacterium]|jgi:hypothetical protein|nr:hypothetical protein [Opitutaceae bacterium]
MIRTLGALLFAAAALRAAPPEAVPLEPGVPAEIYVAPGRATTVLLRSAQKVSAISLASPVITYKYDKPLNQIEITPAVRTGGVETNLNLRIGADVYVLLVHVVEDVRAQFVRTFILPNANPAGDEAELGGARPLAPAELDLPAAARTMERAESDAVFRAAQANLRLEPLAVARRWNGCDILLDEAAQFLDLDLIVFRIHWTNTTPDALYLHPLQYGLVAAGRTLPVLARYSPDDAVVLPGAECRAYLAVQGLRLSRHNAWDLVLPPAADSVAASLEDGRR